MQIRRAGAATASTALLALSALHAAWGAGSAWPGRTRLVSPSSRSGRFARLDRRVYSPLCLALAGLSALSVWPAGDTRPEA
jgi:hypothetical protein